MNDADKAKQLKRHKFLATGLFLLMLVVYSAVTWLSLTYHAPWTGYVKAFSEAAMVGALADWFAVTALFHHPLGLPIPHTNLIENSKRTIGDNLGNFVVGNFLTPKNIRPYIQKLAISGFAAQWLEKDKNRQVLIREMSRLLQDIISKLDSATISSFLARKGAELLNEIRLNVLVANALTYFLDKNEQEQLVTLIAKKLRAFILENEQLVKDKVKAESYFFVPKFVDNKLAIKITNGLAAYFEEIEYDKSHRVRSEISAQLYVFAENLRTESKWEEEFIALKNNLLSGAKLEEYATAVWNSLKATLQAELADEKSMLRTYFSNTIRQLSIKLRDDKEVQEKVDSWIRYNAYRYILRNTQEAGTLISNTVGNWEGSELSRKLELEVGKDLQFIRINGTIVGGLVGVVIHTITMLLS